MQLKICILGIVAVFALTNCASYRTTSNIPEQRALGQDYKVYRATKEISETDTSATEMKEPRGAITLNQALSLALIKNPELAAFSWEVRAREAQALQASLRPNPEIAVEFENFGGSGDLGGFDRTESTILVSQLIELGGKREKRTRVAAFESDLAAWNYEIKRLDIFTETTHAFLDVLAAQERLELDLELVALATKFLASVSRRVEAGATSPAQESRARVALSNARLELGRAQRDLENARKHLAATWGRSNPQFQNVSGDLVIAQDIPRIEPLLELISQNPEVARWAAEMQQRRASVELQEAQKIPDPAIGAGFRRMADIDEYAFLVDVSLPIPIFDRNQGAIEKAQARSTQADFENQAAQVRVNRELNESYQRLSTAFNEVTALQNEVLPEAQKTYDTIDEGYRLGKFGFLEVLDAQKTLFDSRSQYLTSLIEYHKARADLERLVGQSLETIQ